MSGKIRVINWELVTETIEQLWIHCTKCDNSWLIESVNECGCEEE